MRIDTDEKKPVYLDRKIITSKAYWELTGIAPQYLTVFLSKRQMHRVKSNKQWVIRNDGKITFTYAEAKSRFEIAPGRHQRALRQLHALGFIDFNHLGGGMEGDSTTFFISNRWKQYGTPNFKKIEWPKDARKKGNAKIRNYGKGRKTRHNYYG